MPGVTTAAAILDASGLPVDVVCLSSPELLFRALQARRGLHDAEDWILDAIFPEERAAPIVTAWFDKARDPLRPTDSRPPGDAEPAASSVAISIDPLPRLTIARTASALTGRRSNWPPSVASRLADVIACNRSSPEKRLMEGMNRAAVDCDMGLAREHDLPPLSSDDAWRLLLALRRCIDELDATRPASAWVFRRVGQDWAPADGPVSELWLDPTIGMPVRSRRTITADAHALFDRHGHHATRTRAQGHVVAVLGQSLDGFIATQSCHSHFINGRQSLDHLHRVRALSDAVAKAGLPCTVFTDGMTVVIDNETSREPDAAVQCNVAIDLDSMVLEAPLIVVEVVSPSSERDDTGDKLVEYFSVASIRHYLIVNPYKRVVVHHARNDLGTIETRIVTGGAIDLTPPGMAVAAADLLAEADGGLAALSKELGEQP
jgi:hypothetical protein